MILQVLMGIWLVVSPFGMGFREMKDVAINSIVPGIIVAVLGGGISLHEYHHREALSPMQPAEKKST